MTARELCQSTYRRTATLGKRRGRDWEAAGAGNSAGWGPLDPVAVNRRSDPKTPIATPAFCLNSFLIQPFSAPPVFCFGSSTGGGRVIDRPTHSKTATEVAMNLRRDQAFRLAALAPAYADGLRAAAFRRVSLLWMAGISLLAVGPITLVDVPIARWFATDPMPTWARGLLDIASIYGSVLGLVGIGVLMLTSKKRRVQIPRLVAMAAGGGAVATITKLFVLRPRPNSLPLNWTAQEHAWVWSFDPTLSQIAQFDASTRAFPSATLAMAASLTVGLWVMLPRYRKIAVALCIATMVVNMADGQHFASDMLGSAAIGMLWSYVCFHPKLMGDIFHRLEREDSRSPSRKHREKILRLEGGEAPFEPSLTPETHDVAAAASRPSKAA